MGKTINTYCRICEPQCGLIATVEDGRLTKVKGNPDHALSKGHLCIKASAAIDVTYDEDRLLQPMKRVGGPGEFEPVSWDEALTDIVDRLGDIRTKHGPESVATFCGNPAAFNYAASFFVAGFQDTLGIKWRYGPNSDDGAARVAANNLLYGSTLLFAKPDVWRTDFMLVVGANPKVANSSGMAEPKLMEALRGITQRDGRVIVVDPRQTETAKEFEHCPIIAGQDSWLLLGMIRTIIDEKLYDQAYVDANIGQFDKFVRETEPFDAELCAERSGIDSDKIKQLARDFAKAERACVYGRTGTCTQKFGTLTNMLLDILPAITGNLEAVGGNVFGWAPIDLAAKMEGTDASRFNVNPTRVDGAPDVYGMHPSASFVPDALTPGDEQVKALVSIAANPASSSAGAGPDFDEALESLDLHLSLDCYISETNKYADYILPTTTFYERDDAPMLALSTMLRPVLWFTPAVIEPQGDTRNEWEILNEICRRMGQGGAYSAGWMRKLARIGLTFTPRRIFDLMLRTSGQGDKFGLKPKGLNLKKLEKAKNGIQFMDHVPVTSIHDRMKTGDGKVNICHDLLSSELASLSAVKDDPEFPLRLFGRRDLKSINSWLHNAEKVMSRKRDNSAMINPKDAEQYQIKNGQNIKVRTRSGEIQIEAKISDDIRPGQISIPHGWGHSGGWKRANAAGGANPNILTSGSRGELEQIAAMSVFNGLPVAISAVPDINTDQPS